MSSPERNVADVPAKRSPRKKTRKRTAIRIADVAPDSTGYEAHEDPRCGVKLHADRLAVLCDMDSVAARAVGEHMTWEAFQVMCSNAWQKARFKVSVMASQDRQDRMEKQSEDEDEQDKKLVQ